MNTVRSEEAPDEPWTVRRMVGWSAQYLAGKGIREDQARLDSEHLLAAALEIPRLQLYLQLDRPLTPEERDRYKPLLRRRATREPLQYVLGRAAFRELELAVDARVLIPRPETEELVEAVLEWAWGRSEVDRPSRRGPSEERTRLPWSEETGHDSEEGGHDWEEAGHDPDGSDRETGTRTDGPGSGRRPEAGAESSGASTASGGSVRVLSGLDVGTGSGCIALALALEGPFGWMVATDPSEGALELARRNAEECGLEPWVEYRAGRLYEPVAGESFDVIVSNPPYIARSEADELPPEVRDHEPETALFGGEAGMEVLEGLILGAPEHLKRDGLFAVEVGLGMAERTSGRIRDTGAFEEPRIRRDLAGRPRIVTAVRRG